MPEEINKKKIKKWNVTYDGNAIKDYLMADRQCRYKENAALCLMLVPYDRGFRKIFFCTRFKICQIGIILNWKSMWMKMNKFQLFFKENKEAKCAFSLRF